MVGNRLEGAATMTSCHPLETVGTAYHRINLREGQNRLRVLVHDLASRIEPGMREDDARHLANELILAAGFERRWHPSLVRFGEATLCTFLQPSRPDRVLQDDDIFFIDLGAVWKGQEADAGAAFAVGRDSEHHAIASAVQTLWHEVAALSASGGFSGQQLYQAAQQLAHTKGYRLNLEIQGHRVSDYPHSARGTPDLGTFPEQPRSDLWILEIQIAHPQRPFGAFYEDLLT